MKKDEHSFEKTSAGKCDQVFNFGNCDCCFGKLRGSEYGTFPIYLKRCDNMFPVHLGSNCHCALKIQEEFERDKNLPKRTSRCRFIRCLIIWFWHSWLLCALLCVLKNNAACFGCIDCLVCRTDFDQKASSSDGSRQIKYFCHVAGKNYVSNKSPGWFAINYKSS